MRGRRRETPHPGVRAPQPVWNLPPTPPSVPQPCPSLHLPLTHIISRLFFLFSFLAAKLPPAECVTVLSPFLHLSGRWRDSGFRARSGAARVEERAWHLLGANAPATPAGWLRTRLRGGAAALGPALPPASTLLATADGCPGFALQLRACARCCSGLGCPRAGLDSTSPRAAPGVPGVPEGSRQVNELASGRLRVKGTDVFP